MGKTYRKISVIGLGYVGLPTAALLASRGFDVVGVDVNADAVQTINEGRIHIVEPDLDIMVSASVQTGKLRATTTPEPADVFMIAVPTPFTEDRQPDVSYLEAATKALAPHLVAGNLLILESTSPVGTTRQISQWLAGLRPDLSFPHQDPESSDILLAHCPERILPGHVLKELVENDRIIGGLSPRSTEAAAALYDGFVIGDCRKTDAESAELSKLVENAFRDVNIAFANELSMICGDLGLNVWEVIEMANRHPRVNILQPGAGVGGHCIAVDPWFIVASKPERARLIRTAREVNDHKPTFIANRIKAAADKFKTPVIACLGLAYKPDIDDLRESPALEIVYELGASNAGKILAVEPNIDSLPERLKSVGTITLTSLAEAIEQADVIAILVGHKPFRSMDQSQLAEKIVLNAVGR